MYIRRHQTCSAIVVNSFTQLMVCQLITESDHTMNIAGVVTTAPHVDHI